VTIFHIKGDVEDIERNNGRTEVVVDEGVQARLAQLSSAQPVVVAAPCLGTGRVVSPATHFGIFAWAYAVHFSDGIVCVGRVID
jgi:hypothetical protein